jgi:hypothetical protein
MTMKLYSLLVENERMINQPEKGPSFHTDRFMDGYNDGFDACSGNFRGGNGNAEEEGKQDNDNRGGNTGDSGCSNSLMLSWSSSSLFFNAIFRSTNC